MVTEIFEHKSYKDRNVGMYINADKHLLHEWSEKLKHYYSPRKTMFSEGIAQDRYVFRGIGSNELFLSYISEIIIYHIHRATIEDVVFKISREIKISLFLYKSIKASDILEIK